MAREKLWRKRRTSRGRAKNKDSTPRAVKTTPRISRKNTIREIYKNQKWYSHYLLKFTIIAFFGVIWLRLPFKLPILNFVLPAGFLIGLILIVFERNHVTRWIGLGILSFFAAMSYIFAIGITL